MTRYQAGSYQVETWESPSSTLGCAKRVSVLVPPSRTSATTVMPVLYLLHGFGGSRQTWLRGTRLVEVLD